MKFELISDTQAVKVIKEALEFTKPTGNEFKVYGIEFDIYDVMSAIEFITNKGLILNGCDFIVQELMNVSLPSIQMLISVDRLEICCSICEAKPSLIKGLEGYQVRCKCGNKTEPLKDMNRVQKAWSYQNGELTKYLRKSRLSLAK